MIFYSFAFGFRSDWEISSSAVVEPWMNLRLSSSTQSSMDLSFPGNFEVAVKNTTRFRLHISVCRLHYVDGDYISQCRRIGRIKYIFHISNDGLVLLNEDLVRPLCTVMLWVDYIELLSTSGRSLNSEKIYTLWEKAGKKNSVTTQRRSSREMMRWKI